MEKPKTLPSHFACGLSSKRRRESVRAAAAGRNEREKSSTLRDHEMLSPPASVSREVDIRQGAVYKRRTVVPSLRVSEKKEAAIMGLIYWIVVGLIAGWLAGKVMKGGGYGVLIDIILGILGGIVGGWLFGMLGIWPGGGIIGSILVAFVGAVILVWISRQVKKA